MDRAAYGGDYAATDRPQMVGIHFQAHASIFFGVYHQVGGNTAQRLGEDNGGTAMQYSMGLFHLVGHWHGGGNAVVVNLGRLNFQQA